MGSNKITVSGFEVDEYAIILLDSFFQFLKKCSIEIDIFLKTCCSELIFLNDILYLSKDKENKKWKI